MDNWTEDDPRTEALDRLDKRFHLETEEGEDYQEWKKRKLVRVRKLRKNLPLNLSRHRV